MVLEALRVGREPDEEASGLPFESAARPSQPSLRHEPQEFPQLWARMVRRRQEDFPGAWEPELSPPPPGGRVARNSGRRAPAR